MTSLSFYLARAYSAMAITFKSPLFPDIRFYILLAFLLRLTGITNPPLEMGHNWRQATGLMVSRNFLEVNSCILYPRVDDNGGQSGIIGMEFPVMNYTYFLIAKIFGYTHWYGRLINLLVSSFGIYFFYLLTKKYINERTAFFSTLMLLSSIWFSYSRKMMPDTFCISLMLIGIYYGMKYLEEGRKLFLFLFFFFSSLGILSKIPAGIYMILFLFPVLAGDFPKGRKILFCVSGAVTMMLVYAWYFMWNKHLSELSGIWYNNGVSLSRGFGEISRHVGEAMEKFYFSAFDGFIFFACFIAGLFIAFRKKNFRVIYIFSSVGILFLLYIFKSGFFFYHHNYYSIPIVPVMALVAGYALANLNREWLVTILLLGGITEGIANQQHDFFIKDSEKYKLESGKIAERISKKDDLILINGGLNPQQIYLTHRKGWSCENDKLADTLFLKSLIENKCRFIFVDKHTFNSKLNFSIIFSDADFDVYEPDRQ